MPSQMFYFAVARGHRPGVYLTWEEAGPQVNGFPNARHQKFRTRVDAERFIEETGDVGAAGDLPRSDQASGQGRIVMPDVRDTSPRPVPPPRIDPVPEYYAVAEGRVPGIYGTWEEAEVQVKDRFYSKVKKFYTIQEAEDFIEGYKKLIAVDPNDPDPQDPSTLVAFCDGSAAKNGKPGCRAAWAYVFPNNPEWNRAGVLVGRMVTGEIPTNNRAEYRAAVEAILKANQEDSSQTRPLFIFTDCKLLVCSMQLWLSTWKQRDWVKAKGGPVLNKDLLERILQEQGPRKIIWRHVKAHTKRTDWRSVCNHRADQMAREQTSNRSFQSTLNDTSRRKRSLEQSGKLSGKRPATRVGRSRIQASGHRDTSMRISRGSSCQSSISSQQGSLLLSACQSDFI